MSVLLKNPHGQNIPYLKKIFFFAVIQRQIIKDNHEKAIAYIAIVQRDKCLFFT